MANAEHGQNILIDLLARQAAAQRQPFPFSQAWARKLTNVRRLVGHDGCVNRLAWSEDGSLLASGSDDRQVLLWSYPDCDRPPLAIQTEHAANIFGVQFLPCSNNQKIVTGAMDHTVMLHILETAPAQAGAQARRGVASTTCSSTLFACHRARVKGVEVEAGNPHLFWSAAEDNTVRQYDVRLPSNAQKAWESSNCLLSVKAAGNAARSVELKGISLNKAHVHQLAVAAGDAYVRVYDRRMLSTGSPKDARVRGDPMLQMAPPHLCVVNANKRAGRAHTTCVSFGQKGTQLVATYHCDQAYAFDVTASGSCTTAYSPAASMRAAARASDTNTDRALDRANGRWPDPVSQTAAGTAAAPSGGQTAPDSIGLLRQQQQAAVEEAEGLKNQGNHAFFEKDLVRAVHCYSQAVHLNPTSPMLHTNRAAALIARDWVGDAMWALRDCETALMLDPTLPKASYWRIQALKALNQIQAAYRALQDFEAVHPNAGEEVRRLKEDVYALLEERAQHASQRQWRLLQKKRARETAAANARSQSSSAEPELAPQQNLAEPSSADASPDRERASRRFSLDENRQGPHSPQTDRPTPDPPRADQQGSGLPLHRGQEHHSQTPRFDSQQPAQQSASAISMLPHQEGHHQEAAAAPGHDRDSSTMPGPQGGADPQLTPSLSIRTHPLSEQAPSSEASPESMPSEAEPLQEPAGEHQTPLPDQATEPDQATTPSQTSSASPPDQAMSEGEPDQASIVSQAEEAGQDAEAGAGQDPAGLFAQLGPMSSAEPAADDADPPEEGWIGLEIDRHQPGSPAVQEGLLEGSKTWDQSVGGRRMLQRFLGHANVQTDIKEAVFLGQSDALVAAGSDDGNVFIYDAETGQIIRILQADADVANCVQCHPTLPVLATSGIEHTIKLWSPEGENTQEDLAGCNVKLHRNQERITSGPQVLRSISPRVFQALHDNPQLLTLLQQGLQGRQSQADDDAEEIEDERAPGNINCRVN